MHRLPPAWMDYCFTDHIKHQAMLIRYRNRLQSAILLSISPIVITSPFHTLTHYCPGPDRNTPPKPVRSPSHPISEQRSETKNNIHTCRPPAKQNALLHQARNHHRNMVHCHYSGGKSRKPGGAGRASAGALAPPTIRIFLPRIRSANDPLDGALAVGEGHS